MDGFEEHETPGIAGRSEQAVRLWQSEGILCDVHKERIACSKAHATESGSIESKGSSECTTENADSRCSELRVVCAAKKADGELCKASGFEHSATDADG